MRLRRGLVVVAFGLPALVHVACSASNGEPIPPEVRDAEPLDVGSGGPRPPDGSKPPDRDGSTTPPADATTSDAPADARGDASSSAVVRISEIYVERTTAGAQTEYVELSGPPGTTVDDLFVRVVDAQGQANEYDVGASGTKIGASGTWVVGGALASGRIDRIVLLSQGWDLDAPGAVQLLRGANRDVLDVVGWTTDADGGAAPAPATPPTATSEGKPFVLPATGTSSFGRRTSGADTNDNRADFCSESQSCGAANGACL